MFRDGEFTHEQVKLPDAFQQPTILEMMPGQAFCIHAHAVFIDQEDNCWVYKEAATDGSSLDEDEKIVQVIKFHEGLVLNPFGVDEDVRPRSFPREKIGFTESDGDAVIEELEKVIHVVRSDEESLIIADLFEEKFGHNLSGVTAEDMQRKGDKNHDGKGDARKSAEYIERIRNRSGQSLVRIGSAAILAGSRIKKKRR